MIYVTLFHASYLTLFTYLNEFLDVELIKIDVPGIRRLLHLRTVWFGNLQLLQLEVTQIFSKVA